ncbi:MAG: hypothetical protein MJH10_20545 [Epibacterium sp.]|nr:hypothetical protein [Epibacterium sp.]NQX75857.1 hypothetical protein [Epibacterium sp.]
MKLYQVKYNNKQDHAVLLACSAELELEPMPTCIEVDGGIYYTAPHIALLEFIRKSDSHKAEKARDLLNEYMAETPC